MEKKVLRNIFILLLVSATCFFALRYIVSLRENIASLKGDVSALENQKQNLLQEIEKEKITVQRLNARNAGLKDHLKSARKRLNKSFAALGRVEDKLNKLGSQFSILKAENSALLEEKEQLARENETMKAKLNSADELKKALRNLKNAIIAEGNRGYLIKDRKSTFGAKIKIEVAPAPR